MPTVDELFAKITIREQRAARTQRRHEYRMTQLENMDGEDKVIFLLSRAGIRSLAAVLIVLIVAVGSCEGATKWKNDYRVNHDNNQQLTDCEKAATAAHMFADCDQYDIRQKDK